MSEKELRRSMAVLPMGTVMKLTDLTARQVRYYEQQELVKPFRNEGNRRLFSLNDVDRLLEIKDFLKEGLNISDITKIFNDRAQVAKQKEAQQRQQLTDSDIRSILQDELLSVSGLKPPSSMFDHHSKFDKFNN